MKREEAIFQQPWRLVQNKVRAEGGREIDRFRGVLCPMDTQNGAEAWIGSVTKANGTTPENPCLGCAEVILPDGNKRYLFEVIHENPEQILGERHVQRFGTSLGILVKYLDAKKKFLLQCHPTRAVAKAIWDSDYGKTECWYVLSTREEVADASIYLGFKPGITREGFEAAYRRSSLEHMEEVENLCHRIPVKAGETYFIHGGMPHALGVGCFVIEIQEPSDLTSVPIPQQDLLSFRQQANPQGVFKPIDNELYERRTLESFDYTGRELEEVLHMCKTVNPVIRKSFWGEERLIVGKTQTEYFSCTELNAHGECELLDTGAISIGIVTEGEGELWTEHGSLQVARGSEIFIPYHANHVIAKGNLKIVLSHPGGAEIPQTP